MWGYEGKPEECSLCFHEAVPSGTQRREPGHLRHTGMSAMASSAGWYGSSWARAEVEGKASHIAQQEGWGC